MLTLIYDNAILYLNESSNLISQFYTITEKFIECYRPGKEKSSRKSLRNDL